MNVEPNCNERPDEVFFFYRNGEKPMNNDSTRIICSEGIATVMPDE